MSDTLCFRFRKSRDLNERAPGARARARPTAGTDALLDDPTRVGCNVDVSLERPTMRVVFSLNPPTLYPRDNASRLEIITKSLVPRVVDGGVTATGVLSRQRGNLITIVITHY
jgi:hypothetical protein